MTMLPMYMLQSYLDKFKDNMEAYSEEQGKRFNPDII